MYKNLEYNKNEKISKMVKVNTYNNYYNNIYNGRYIKYFLRKKGLFRAVNSVNYVWIVVFYIVTFACK